MTLVRALPETLIEVSGDDAREWLGGQMTCDLRTPKAGSATYGLILSAKGKIISDAWVLDGPATTADVLPTLSLSVPTSVLPAVLARLERFLVMEDVDLTVSDAELVSVQGAGARSALSQHARAFELGAIWSVPRIADEGVETWVKAGQGKELAAALTPCSEREWEDARVLAGVPKLGCEMGEDTLPQELGLRSSISFDKGCYVGQEPVIMLEHRGKPPKRLVRLSAHHVKVGDALTADGQKAGVVTSVHSDGTHALALVRRKLLETPLQAGGVPATVLEIVER